jgi:DNA mismatch repair protein MutS2
VLEIDEIHLRHLTVDEALLKLDKYLNDAFMAGLYQVRVVHGKGTGTLRRIVREQLAKHPLVKSYRPGGYGEGGAGVTIVELT